MVFPSLLATLPGVVLKLRLRKREFTRIELLVVIAISAVLIAVLRPAKGATRLKDLCEQKASNSPAQVKSIAKRMARQRSLKYKCET